MKHIFNGRAEKIAKDITDKGHRYGVSLGRRAPMHKMHVDCIREIMDAGMEPVIMIGSVNGPESPMYDPVRNPLTPEQQEAQIAIALPKGAAYRTLRLNDHPDDAVWVQGLVDVLKENGIQESAVMHFRSKAADEVKDAAKVTPLNQFTQSFIENDLSVWQSYNADFRNDDICASAIRNFDLENLTPEQRDLIAAPEYIIDLARKARFENPDGRILDANNIPVTMLDLSFDRMRKEAGITTSSIFYPLWEKGALSLGALQEAAAEAVKSRDITAANQNVPKKPLLLIGNSASPESVETLKGSGYFDVVPASIGKFQSGEHYVEMFYGEQDKFAINAEKIKGAKAVVVQSTAGNVGDNIQYLLAMIHTLKYYGAAEVTAVLPFSAYARQDRAFENRFCSVSAELLPLQLKAAGVDKTISMTMHSQASCQAYKKVFGNDFTALSTADVFANYLTSGLGFKASDIAVGAPDGAEKIHDEGQRRARELTAAVTGSFNASSMFRISKVHTDVNETKITSFDGNVEGKNCVIVDDMVDGGTTMVNAAKTLKANGAKSVTCCFTHPVLSAGSLEKLMSSGAIDKLAMTDAIPDAAEKLAVFAAKYPDLAAKIDIISLGKAALDEVSRQLGLPSRAKAVPSLLYRSGLSA